MFSLIGSASRRTLVVPITLISFLTACYNHTQVDAPYAQALEVKLPKQLRITVGEDSTFKVKEPRLEDDMLIGISEPCRSQPYTRGRCESTFAWSDITRLEERENDGVATGFLNGGVSILGIGVALGITWAIVCADGSCYD